MGQEILRFALRQLCIDFAQYEKLVFNEAINQSTSLLYTLLLELLRMEKEPSKQQQPYLSSSQIGFQTLFPFIL